VIPVISKWKNIDSIWLFLVQTLYTNLSMPLVKKEFHTALAYIQGVVESGHIQLKYCASISMLIKPSTVRKT